MSQCNKLLELSNINSLLNAFENSIEPIAITDANWDNGIKFIYVNSIFCLETGYLQEELIGQNPKILQGEESNYKILNELKRELIDGNDFIGQSVNYRKDGSSYNVKWSISPLKDKNNNTIAYISFQKIIDQKIKFENEKLLSSIVENSNNLILVTDLNGVIVYTNKTFNTTLGYGKDELTGKHSRILKSDMQDDEFYKTMWRTLLKNGSFSGVFESKKKDGTFFYDKKHITTIKDDNGSSIYYVSISQDISKQKKYEEDLKKEIYIDPLTNIFNRRKFDKTIDEKIEGYRLNQEIFSLVLIDIDHFKVINDKHGHEKGDFILKEFARLIRENIRDNDQFFRWGGEEFALIIDKNIDETIDICEKLKSIIKQHDFQSIKLTASFGVSYFKHSDNKKSLFAKTDKALYKAKHSGRDKVEALVDEKLLLFIEK